MELTTPEPIHVECKRFSGVLSLIGDKWTVMIVMTLTERPRRFNDIKRTIGGIANRCSPERCVRLNAMAWWPAPPTQPCRLRWSTPSPLLAGH